MSDAAIIALIGAISGMFSAVVTGYFGYKIKVTTETTLKHVNHAAIAQQKIYAISARLNATLLKDNAVFAAQADKAELDLANMERAQEQIDRGAKS